MYNGEYLVSTLEPSFLIGSSSFLQQTRKTTNAWMSLNFGGYQPLTSELAALERLKKTIYNLVSTLAPSFLIGFSSFLQVRRTTIIYRMSSKFGTIRPHTVELAFLERLKKKSHRLITGKILLALNTLEPFILIESSFILAGNKDNHKSLDEFEFRWNSTSDFALEHLKNRTTGLLAL